MPAAGELLALGFQNRVFYIGSNSKLHLLYVAIKQFSFSIYDYGHCIARHVCVFVCVSVFVCECGGVSVCVCGGGGGGHLIIIVILQNWKDKRYTFQNSYNLLQDMRRASQGPMFLFLNYGWIVKNILFYHSVCA